ncbi:alpha/beta fold hydrolase [Dactylosporangium siamense]|uniref:NB-ARC domain-containing protein n=1 Tax=Dactylosporangium siamense TaxID=685454 RepID=A0A919U9U7_9ACTN|nr:alpha/beta fold hydrolase [Dactylosporangium siamense]GIG44095.1 hypothetical protein Dsi01nite_021360 [Dactylosporangium siamense]
MTGQDARLALVFIHGFLSGPHTWTQMESLLSSDAPVSEQVTVYQYEYTSKIAQLNPLKRLPSIDNIARGLGDFIDLRVVEPSILLVAHSQGGLVAQRYIAAEVSRPESSTLHRVVGLLMYATPTGGSDLALSLRRPLFRLLGGNPQERELRPLDEQVNAAQRRIFESILIPPDPRYRIKILATVGTEDNVVKDVPGRSVFPDTRTLPGDHFTIIKPSDLDDVRYLTLKHEVQTLTDQTLTDQTRSRPKEASEGRRDLTATIFALPSAPRDFVGRAAELEQLLRIRNDLPPLFANIYGRAGIGKTTLAIVAAQRFAPDYDRTIYINMRGYEAEALDTFEVTGEILRAYGLAPSKISRDRGLRSGQLRAILGTMKTLLVLDNCADEHQVRPLLPADGSTGVIVTSRQAISIEGLENLWLRELDMNDAKELIYRNRAYDQADERIVEQLCATCGRLPLALRIVAAALRLRPESTLTELDRTYSNSKLRLAEMRIGDLDLEASLSLNYPSLEPAAQKAFGLLATLPTAEFQAWHLGTGDGTSLDTARRSLQRLADQQFVDVVGRTATATERQYRYHDLLRDLGRKFAASDDEARVRFLRNVLAAYIVLAEEAGLAIGLDGGQIEGALGASTWVEIGTLAVVVRENPVTWMDGEARNITVLIEQAFKDGLFDEVWLLARAVSTYLDSTCSWDAWINACRLGAEAAARSHNVMGSATMALHLGVALSRIGRASEAQAELQKASDVFTSIGDKVGIAWAQFRLGESFRLGDSPAEATQCYREALASLEGVEAHTAMRSYPHLGLGSVYRVAGDVAGAVRELSAGLSRAIADGYPRAVGWIGFSLAQALSDAGDYAAAAASLSQAREAFERYPAKIGQTWVALVAIELKIRSGALPRDGGQLAELDHLIENFRTIGDTRGEAWGWFTIAQIAVLHGDRHRATGALDNATALFTECGSELGTAQARLQLASITDDSSRERLLSLARQQLDALGCRWPDELIAQKVVGWRGW